MRNFGFFLWCKNFCLIQDKIISDVPKYKCWVYVMNENDDDDDKKKLFFNIYL